MNHSSSRSHTLFRITVKAVTNSFIRNFRHENKGQSNVNVHNLMADLNHESEGTVVTESYLNFVDLAGSERINSHMKWVDEEVQDNIRDNKKNLQESRMKEGRSINKSLFFLTQVISLKAEGKANQHIPFRNSPLTKILRSSLGGNFRTLVILCVNPCLSQHEISMSTLRFGQNAKKIQNSIKANIVTNNNDESIKILIENYEKKMRDLQQQRDEDLLKYQQYVHIIDELSIQRSILLERLEQANKKLSVHIVDEMPEATLLNFFKQASTKLAITYEAGLLFVPESQKKYEKVHEAEAEDTSSNHLKQTFDRQMRANSKDVVNRFALQAYNRTRREFDIIKDHVDKQESYLQELSQSFQSVWATRPQC